MYYRDNSEQLAMEEFFQPFGGRLRKDNRWVRLAGIMPSQVSDHETLFPRWLRDRLAVIPVVYHQVVSNTGEQKAVIQRLLSKTLITEATGIV